MRIRTFIILSLVLSGFACSKVEEDKSHRQEVCLNAVCSSPKTILSGKEVHWTAGDAVSVFDGKNNNRFDTDESGSSAVFKGTAELSYGYYVLYPYSADATVEGSSIHVEFPQSQCAVAGGFAQGANISVGITAKEGEGIWTLMKNAGCYLKFDVGGSNSGVSKVEVVADGGEKISGWVQINFDNDRIPIISPLKGASNKVNLISEDKGFLAGTYYIVLCPTVISDGITVRIYKGDKFSSFKASNLSELERNQVYAIKGNVDTGIISIGNEGLLKDASPWNEWYDAESVRQSFIRARKVGKTYFSQFKFYSFEEYGSLIPYKGLNHPLMYGMDFYKGSGEYYPESMRNGIRANLMNVVKSAWRENRAICSFSWHLESPYAVYNDFTIRQGQSSGCSYIDQTHVASSERVWVDNFPPEHRYQVREILENREVHYVNEYVNPETGQKERFERTFKLGDWFDDRCREVAGMINEMVDDNGKPIPILLRLWHELEDRWAWWQLYYFNESRQNCTVEEYKRLWARTVTNFRKMCPDAEILFVYCMDRNFADEEKYLRAYPGDEYVDIMGYDDYYIGRPEKYENSKQATLDAIINRARVVSKAAASHGKLAMICETNNESEDISQHALYYSDYVQPILKDSQTNIHIFQIWSSPGNSDSKLAALKSFVKEENIIFDK